MDQEGFLLTPRMAGVFFRTIKLYRIGNNMEKRMALMRKIIARKEGTYLRDVKPFLAGKTVLKITSPKERPNA